MVSPAQQALLAYLHARSGGSGRRIGLDPKPVMHALRLSPAQFTEDSASLAAHGLVGVRDVRADANDVPSRKCSAIWVTGKGEDYLRRPPPGCQRRTPGAPEPDPTPGAAPAHAPSGPTP